ncbi:MAG: hypothetical protein AB7P12_10170 [Alphaproteobacteria bacterium]
MEAHAANIDERILQRLTLTLVGLAVIAERAALRNDDACRHVVWLLWQAESAVGYFVFEATGTPPPAAYQEQAADGDGPLEALRLAACFKALAAILAALLLMAQRHSLPVGLDAYRAARPLGALTREPNDTS